MNIAETAKELTLLPESFVFVDDNPAETGDYKGSGAWCGGSGSGKRGALHTDH